MEQQPSQQVPEVLQPTRYTIMQLRFMERILKIALKALQVLVSGSNSYFVGASTGWPFYNQPMHLILWEQDYTADSGIQGMKILFHELIKKGDTLGEFMVLDVQIWLPASTYNGTNSTPTTGGTRATTGAAGSGTSSGTVGSTSSTSETENSTGEASALVFAITVCIIALLVV